MDQSESSEPLQPGAGVSLLSPLPLAQSCCRLTQHCELYLKAALKEVLLCYDHTSVGSKLSAPISSLEVNSRQPGHGPEIIFPLMFLMRPSPGSRAGSRHHWRLCCIRQSGQKSANGPPALFISMFEAFTVYTRNKL